MTDAATKTRTFAIFAPEPQMTERLRGVLMYVTKATDQQNAFDQFDADVGAGDYTADDHFIDEVPESWLEEAWGPYDYNADEIL